MGTDPNNFGHLGRPVIAQALAGGLAGRDRDPQVKGYAQLATMSCRNVFTKSITSLCGIHIESLAMTPCNTNDQNRTYEGFFLQVFSCP